MLKELRIKDYALIEELKINFSNGLNILTGETGAGKSIIIEALKLVLGERADTKVIRKGSESCKIDALFFLNGKEITLSREIRRDGASRCFFNQEQITVSALSQLGENFVDIHGQYQHQVLLKSDNQRDFLDRFGNLSLLVEEVKKLYQQEKEFAKQLQDLVDFIKEKKDLLELYNFQIKEISDANLNPGEEEELEEEFNILNNAEKLYILTEQSYSLLSEEESCVEEKLAKISSLFEELSCIDHSKIELKEMIESLIFQAEEISQRLREYREKIEFNPARLEEVIQRLELIKKLKNKYGNTIEEILDYKTKIETKLNDLTLGEEKKEELEKKISQVQKTLNEKLEELTKKRKIVAQELAKRIQEELHNLGMEKLEFQIDILPDEVNIYGKDKIVFLIKPNPGEDLLPLSKIASGGELSRIMLGLKTVLADVDDIQTLIFDEIDIGISGRVAEIVGEKLYFLSKTKQIICITHLPQIARFASRHFLITKQMKNKRTITYIQMLGREERVQEIARLLAGKKITPLALQTAQEMLEGSEQ